MRIYITHCCGKKDDALKGTGIYVAPDKLYTATPTKRFMETCKECGVHWAILSDKYGVWFAEIKREWYEKDPSTVSEAGFALLLDDFDAKLKQFEEIWFYYNPGRFHLLYKRLLSESKLCGRIHKFSHLWDIDCERLNKGRVGVRSMKQRDSSANSGSVRVTLKEGAQILDELQICKAYRSPGKINGPNCYRFGHRDPQTGRWDWDVAELTSEAEKRKSTTPEMIRRVRDRYGISDREADPRPKSRAELEHAFRQAHLDLEHVLIERLPTQQSGEGRRTLGNLIHEANDNGFLDKCQISEAIFVNAVRNMLYHRTSEDIPGDRIRRATDSARALCAELKECKAAR